MNRKNSKIKFTLYSILCLVLGIIVGFVSNIFFSLPDSYRIPKTVQGTKSSLVSASSMDAEFIKESNLSIHFLELGNKFAGDCVYIKVGDVDILVDAGSRSSSIPYITNYVDSYCTDKVIDFVIVTHAHEDHYAGFSTNENGESLFDYYTDENRGTSIKTVITFAKQNKTEVSNAMFNNFSRELRDIIAEGTNVHTVLECYNNNEKDFDNGRAMRNYILGYDDDGNEILLQFLYQKYYEEYSSSENNYSVCFQIVQGEKKYLFTGDLEAEGEKSMVEHYKGDDTLSQVELYKAGHHGSKTSSCDELMYVIQPKIVVVTCVAGSSEYTSKNENQFPTQEFIDNVSIYTDNIYVTSLCIDYKAALFEAFNGTIAICSSGDDPDDKTTVLSTNHQIVLRESDWFKNNRTLPENAVIDPEDSVA